MTDTEEATNARRTAIRRAIGIGAACGLACFAFGKPADAAAIDGAIVTIGGLIAWTTYHLISGRSDFLTLALLNTLPIWRRSADPWLPTLIITSLTMLGVGIVLGFVNRPQASEEPAPDFSWWDAEIDGPR